MKKVRALIFDFDGCVSPHKIYGKDGLCYGKTVKDLEWTALKRFKVAGVAIEAITGDNWNADILYNRQISYTLSRGTKKEDYLPDICKRHNVEPEEVAYVGDDIFDVGLLKAVGHPFAPYDATRDIFNLTKAQELYIKGGENVISEMFYILRSKGLISYLPFDEEFDKILELDAKQKF